MPAIVNDGGNQVTTYNLWMDDGQNGEFFSVLGTESDN